MGDPSDDASPESSPDDLTRIYRGRVDVIDLATCTLVASQLNNQLLLPFDDRTMLGYGVTELGANHLDVLRVRLNRSPLAK